MERTTIEFAKDFFATLYRGAHHIPGKIKEWGNGWCVNHYGTLSTYDFDTLTRLVLLAHDRCARIEVINSGPSMLKIAVWKRDGREGGIAERHPTIETALAKWREVHPKVD